MEVRATKAFRHSGKHYSEGDVFSLDLGPALGHLQEGSVEPAIDLEPLRPSLDIKGLTLWDAYLLHVHGFPPLKPLLDEADSKPKPYRLRVCQFAELPKWVGFPAAGSGRSARPRRNFATDWRDWDEWQDWGDGVRVTVGPLDYWSKSGPSLEERYQNALRDYLQRAAIHFFLERLAEGELDAMGVGEGDLKTLDETKIPAGLWQRHIELDLHRNEICELMGPKPEQRVRRYSGVHIQKPTAPQECGGPGCPSSEKLGQMGA